MLILVLNIRSSIACSLIKTWAGCLSGYPALSVLTVYDAPDENPRPLPTSCFHLGFGLQVVKSTHENKGELFSLMMAIVLVSPSLSGYLGPRRGGRVVEGAPLLRA